MRARQLLPRAGRWVSASEVRDYAYCPRSWWYRTHPPRAGVTIESRWRSRVGVRYHRDELGATLWRDRWAGLATLVAAGVLAATVLAIFLGG